MKRFYVAVLLCTLAILSCQKEPAVVSVANVTLNMSSVEITEGETASITATISPDNADNKKVLWTSSDASVATVSNGIVTAVKPGTATITATSDDGRKTASCTVNVKARVYPVTGVSLDKTTHTLTEGDTQTLNATVSPSNATNKNVTWSSSDESVAKVDNSGKVTAVKAGTATITVKTEDGGKTASCVVTVYSDEYVDLGLSVKWATCNLGATKPEEYGLYYQWGDTQGYSSGKYFGWSDGIGNVTYKWCNGSENSLTKYNTKSLYGTVDNKTVLDMEDDAARVALGGNWRMPTDAEWTELRNNCTWTWISNYNGTGVAGMIVASKKSGYTNKSIFLPAAGCRSGDGLLSHAGSGGYYCSSSLCTDGPYYAWLVSFDSGNVSKSLGYRYLGQSVRPVSE